MDEKIKEETKLNFEKANIILTYIFSLYDIFILIIFKFLLYPKLENIFSLKYKLFFLIIIDCISKLLYYITNNNFNSLLKELLYIMLTGVKFYLILSFAFEIFYSSLKFIKAQKIKLISPLLISIIFLLVIFPYDKYFYSRPNILEILESLIIIIYLFNLFKYIRDIINVIDKHLKSYDKSNEKVYLYLQILNYASLILFICYYIGKMISILFYNYYFIIYIKILINIFYESLRYLLFYIFIKIIYILNDNYNNNNKDNNANINKNDEETVIINKQL